MVRICGFALRMLRIDPFYVTYRRGGNERQDYTGPKRKTKMRSQHHHPYRNLKEWHAGQRDKRKTAIWTPYSLRWKGGAFVRILPQVWFVPRDVRHRSPKLNLYAIIDASLWTCSLFDLRHFSMDWRSTLDALPNAVPNFRVNISLQISFLCKTLT